MSFPWQPHRADLKSLEYLKYCIKESMRLFPPVSGNGRVLAEDMEIEGHMMPKGTALGTSIYTVHRHPDFWENPNVSSKVTEGRCSDNNCCMRVGL